MIEKINEIDCVMQELEVLKDDMEGVGDKHYLDAVVYAVRLLDEYLNINIAKHSIVDGGKILCPNCRNYVGIKNGRCFKCGQIYYTKLRD